MRACPVGETIYPAIAQQRALAPSVGADQSHSLAGCGEHGGVRKQSVKTTVETAVMIRGRTRRKTMKRHRLNP